MRRWVPWLIYARPCCGQSLWKPAGIFPHPPGWGRTSVLFPPWWRCSPGYWLCYPGDWRYHQEEEEEDHPRSQLWARPSVPPSCCQLVVWSSSKFVVVAGSVITRKSLKAHPADQLFINGAVSRHTNSLKNSSNIELQQKKAKTNETIIKTIGQPSKTTLRSCKI